MDENGPFVVDLSTQSGDFPYSYGSLPEGNGNVMGIAIQFFRTSNGKYTISYRLL